MARKKIFLEDELIICLDYYLKHKDDSPMPRRCIPKCANPCLIENHQIGIEMSKICTSIRQRAGHNGDIAFRPSGSVMAKFTEYISIDPFNSLKGFDKGSNSENSQLNEKKIFEKYHGNPWDPKKEGNRRKEIERISKGLSEKIINSDFYLKKSSLQRKAYSSSDPKEIDKKTGKIVPRKAKEKELEQSYKEFLEETGITVNDRHIYETETTKLYGDLFIDKSNFIIEVKLYSREGLRMVIGQIKDYALMHYESVNTYPYMAALFDKKPLNELIRLLEREKIYCIWKDRKTRFSDNFPTKDLKSFFNFLGKN